MTTDATTPATTSAMTDAPLDDRQLVWDLPLRVFHWSLVLAIAGSFVTHYGSEMLSNAGVDPFAWHARCGYASLVLVAFRVLWGFVGPAHARFADFVRGPRAAWSYARGLFRGPGAGEPAAHAVGHNALGGWMVLLLLVLVIAQAVAGLFANDQIMNAGPLVGYVETSRSDALTTVHRQLSNVIAAAVLLHVSAALWYLLARRENLIGAMVSGYKRGLPPGAAIGRQRIALAVALVGAASVVLWWVIRNAPPANVFGY
jgi:cytochrome b